MAEFHPFTRYQENIMAGCPECEQDIQVGGLDEGEIIHCEDCGAELELTTLEPAVFALAPEIGEDYGE